MPDLPLPSAAVTGGNRAARRRAKRAQEKGQWHDLEQAYRSRTPRPNRSERRATDRREKRQRPAPDVSFDTEVPDGLFRQSLRMVRAQRFVEAYSQRLDHRVGRPRDITLLAFFVVMQIVGNRRNQVPNVIEYARVLNSLKPHQMNAVGLGGWDKHLLYDKFDDLYNKWHDAVREGFPAYPDGLDGERVWVCEQWHADQVVDSSIHDDTVLSKSLAGDGTGTRAWAGSGFEPVVVDDANVPEMPDDVRPEIPTRRWQQRVYGHTEEGRELLTRDWEATGGYRGGNGDHRGGTYCGWESHFFTQVRGMRRNGTVGDDVAPVVRRVVTVAAGTHRNRAVIEQLVEWKTTGAVDFDHLLLDRGYTYLKQETLQHRLSPLNVRVHMDLHTNQRKSDVTIHGTKGVIRRDGGYFDERMPQELCDLDPHDSNDSDDERARKAKKYDQREPYRWEEHGAMDADGYQRLISPWHLGKLWSDAPAFRHLRSKRRPGGEQFWFDDDVECPPATITVAHEEGTARQPYGYGTTKWVASYGRRSVVEGTFGTLKSTFARIDQRGWVRTFGKAKFSLAVAYAVAGHNLRVQKTFNAVTAKAKQAAAMAAGRRARRRTRAVADLVAAERRRADETFRTNGGASASGDPPGVGPPS